MEMENRTGNTNVPIHHDDFMPVHCDDCTILTGYTNSGFEISGHHFCTTCFARRPERERK